MSNKYLDIAMEKVIKQEINAVLDKIRAEIEQMDFDFGDFYDNTIMIREMVFEVIDKYKQENK